jgi:hypothetical protein
LPTIRYVITDSTETYMWDLVTVKNLVEFPINVSQPTSGAAVISKPLFQWDPDVGDSHRGPLKNWGKTHFLSQKTKHKRIHNHKTHPRQSRLSSRGPRSWRPQWPTRTVSPSHPRAKLRFARGAQHRSNKTPPRSRAGCPLG